ncbi:transmembrane protein 201 isoform X2 [Gopherus flavomarginatus]|uniref:transmembrane protein 201 isoform X2 n=1 Tax=Gopherus flavomarginatus TaxID=286002 RepID=UPI0021CBD73B|nr:transmembrane protein 201 isoform X2 [Gopherus flavomarginatus]
MTVNCWFCNQDTVVPYGNRNCWDCPYCEQYNGFQEGTDSGTPAEEWTHELMPFFAAWQNGDYNKPIPAQYMEHLNHVVSGAATFCDPTKPQQWVSSQILLCKKCNNHQTMKIKQLASFAPREEGKYDEEIEVYKHHLEQTYKLCRPCQAAVEYYIKHQNRQLRALLLSHHFKRRETDKPYMQSFCSSSSSMSTPTQVIILRFLTFLSCVFLVLMASYGSGDPFSLKGAASAPMESGPTAIRNGTGASPAAASENRTLLGVAGWWELLHLLPEKMVKNLSVAWTYGRNHQIAVVVLGLATCLLAMLLAGRIRLRRIDAFASVLWLLVMGLHLAEKYLKADMPSWLDTAKFGTTSLCCLVGFTAAVATRKSTGQRRYRPRRFLSGDSVALFPNGSGIGFPCSAASPSVFIPTPPSILQLTNQQFFRSPRRASSSSLPGRLNRALSLGTIPSLARTDSGYLFSGSRPASQGSQSKDSPASEYYSLLSGSCAPSPIPSPAPSVTGSITSSSGSLRYRRPLISPARLNLKGQKLLLFPSQSDALHTSISLDEPTHPDSNVFAAELTPFPRKNLNERGMHDKRSVMERGSICSNNSIKKEDNSSHSSTCVVDTTTKGEDLAGWRELADNSRQCKLPPCSCPPMRCNPDLEAIAFKVSGKLDHLGHLILSLPLRLPIRVSVVNQDFAMWTGIH